MIGLLPAAASATVWQGSTDDVVGDNDGQGPGRDIARFEASYDDEAGTITTRVTFASVPSAAEDSLVGPGFLTPECGNVTADTVPRALIGGNASGGPVEWGLVDSSGNLTDSGTGTRSLSGRMLTLGATATPLAGQTLRCALVGISNTADPTEIYDYTDLVVLRAQPPPPDDTAVTLKIGGTKLRLNRKGVARLRLGCPASEVSPPCRGRLKLKTAKKVRLGRTKRKVGLAKARFSIEAGTTPKVKLKLGKRKTKLVRNQKKARRAVAVANASDAAGNSGTAKKRLTLKPR